MKRKIALLMAGFMALNTVPAMAVEGTFDMLGNRPVSVPSKPLQESDALDASSTNHSSPEAAREALRNLSSVLTLKFTDDVISNTLKAGTEFLIELDGGTFPESMDENVYDNDFAYYTYDDTTGALVSLINSDTVSVNYNTADGEVAGEAIPQFTMPTALKEEQTATFYFIDGTEVEATYSDSVWKFVFNGVTYFLAQFEGTGLIYDAYEGDKLGELDEDGVRVLGNYYALQAKEAATAKYVNSELYNFTKFEDWLDVKLNGEVEKVPVDELFDEKTLLSAGSDDFGTPVLGSTRTAMSIYGNEISLNAAESRSDAWTYRSGEAKYNDLVGKSIDDMPGLVYTTVAAANTAYETVATALAEKGVSVTDWVLSLVDKLASDDNFEGDSGTTTGGTDVQLAVSEGLDSELLSFTITKLTLESFNYVGTEVGVDGKYTVILSTTEGLTTTFTEYVSGSMFKYAGNKYNPFANKYSAYSYGGLTQSMAVPYTISYVSPTTAKVKILVDITPACAGTPNNYYPTLRIPMGSVVADGNGSVSISIDDYGNSQIKALADNLTLSSEAGSKAELEAEMRVFDDKVELSTIVLKEVMSGTFQDGDNDDNNEATITFKLSSGFRFRDIATYNQNKIPVPVIYLYDNEGNKRETLSYEIIDDVIVLSIPDGSLLSSNVVENLRLEGFYIETENETRESIAYMTAYSDYDSQNFMTDKIPVASRENLGFDLSYTNLDADEDGNFEVTTIYSGRHYRLDTTNNMAFDQNITERITFSEKVPNTLVNSRALDFHLPDGVKFANFDLISQSNFTNLSDVDFSILNDGQTLRLERTDYSVTTDTNLANFSMDLELSIAPYFEGDIELSVEGGGMNLEDTDPIVLATAVKPFEIGVSTTDINLGYQEYNVADITITEVEPGLFLEDGKVTLAINAPYGTGEMGFSNATFTIDSESGLEVKDLTFGLNEGGSESGIIEFKVTEASYEVPATVSLSNVTVGTTRSVPYGTYNLKLAGSAVLNNYAADVDSLKFGVTTSKTTEASTWNSVWYQDSSNGFYSDEYINVVTPTGTVDKVVSLTIGQKSISVGGNVYTMDVEPIIRNNSTLVPLRFVVLALASEEDLAGDYNESSMLSWDNNTKTASILIGSGVNVTTVTFTANSSTMYVNGAPFAMTDVAGTEVYAVLENNRLYIPFRNLGYVLGVTVDWDEATKTATYTPMATNENL